LLLAIPTLGIALIALPLFTMYVIPAVVSGGHDGYTAIGESGSCDRSSGRRCSGFSC
ncbi:MAG: hypothetical protein JO225_10960, partial [Candidatus Eremiobacteraeota bacterium]|nr:hypothetical protein [Candidatus Eremiobacteraeota bacterium]